MYIMRSFDLEMWFKCMEQYQITECAFVPPIVILTIMSPLRHKYSLKGVRNAICGAAPLDKRPQARIQELLADDAPFTQVGVPRSTCSSQLTVPGLWHDRMLLHRNHVQVSRK